MVMTDPPKHTTYRKLVNSGFTPRMVRRLEDAFRLRATTLLNEVTPDGQCDFVTSISSELPLMAIAEIVGVPQEDRDKLFDWSNRTIGGADEEYYSEYGDYSEYSDYSQPPADLDAANAYDYYSGDEAEEGA